MHTNKTTNYELPLFTTNDKPTWLGDINGAMTVIDAGMHSAQQSANDAYSLAQQVNAQLESAVTNANEAREQSAQALDSANQAHEDAQNAISTATDALTHAEAVEEKYDGLNTRVTTLENVVGNSESGLVVKVAQNSNNIDSLCTRMTNAESAIASADLANIGERLTACENSESALNLRVTTNTTNISENEQQITSLKAQTQSLASTVAGHTTKIADIEAQLTPAPAFAAVNSLDSVDVYEMAGTEETETYGAVLERLAKKIDYTKLTPNSKILFMYGADDTHLQASVAARVWSAYVNRNGGGQVRANRIYYYSYPNGEGNSDFFFGTCIDDIELAYTEQGDYTTAQYIEVLIGYDNTDFYQLPQTKQGDEYTSTANAQMSGGRCYRDRYTWYSTDSSKKYACVIY